MGLRSALGMFRAQVEAVPPGAPRPSMTMWYDPGGVRPPVAWAPVSGEFSTLWDWELADALALPGVWRARKLLSDTVGAMTIGAWRGDEALRPLPAVLVEPVPGEDRANTIAAWMTDLLDHGNAVGIYDAYNAEDKPVSVTPVPCSEVSIGRTDAGRVFYQVGGPSGPTYDRSVVFHAKANTTPGGLRGLGVLEVGLSTLALAHAEADYAAKAFTSGTPSGLLRVSDPDLQVGSDDDEASYVTAKGIKKAWAQSVSAGDIAVLSELVDFQPLGWTPTDAQMVEARQLSLTDIANMYGLDGYWIGAPAGSMTYQNVQQAAQQLSRFTLEFPITALEAEFSRMLPRGTEARFNRDSILRDDQTTRVNNWTRLLQSGVVTVDEVRAVEGLPALTAGQKAELGGAAAQQQKPAAVSPLFPASDPEANETVGA